MLNIGVIIIVAVSSVVKGVTGLGFTLLSFPLLLIWYTPKEIIPVLTVCNLIGSLMIVLQKKEKQLIDKNSYILIGVGAVFTILGVVALSSTDGTWLVRGAGIVFIILTILAFWGRKSEKKDFKTSVYAIVGMLIGFLAGAVSVSGPPLVLFLNKINVSNLAFREITATFNLITAIIAVIGYWKADMFNEQSIKLILIFAPILFLGTIVGKKINTAISVSSFQILNIVITLFASIMFILH